MNTIYVVYIVNETKKTRHQCMLKSELKGFLESSNRFAFKCYFFCLRKSMRKLSKGSFLLSRQLQYIKKPHPSVLKRKETLKLEKTVEGGFFVE